MLLVQSFQRNWIIVRLSSFDLHTETTTTHTTDEHTEAQPGTGGDDDRGSIAGPAGVGAGAAVVIIIIVVIVVLLMRRRR